MGFGIFTPVGLSSGRAGSALYGVSLRADGVRALLASIAFALIGRSVMGAIPLLPVFEIWIVKTI